MWEGFCSVEVPPSPNVHKKVLFVVWQLFVKLNAPQLGEVKVKAALGPMSALPPLQAPPKIRLKPVLEVEKLSTSRAYV